MGYKTKHLLERLTSAYLKNTTIPDELPEGYNLTISPAVTKNQVSSSTELTIEIEANGYLKVVLKPADNEVWISHPTGGTKKFLLSGFTQWKVVDVTIDHLKLQLGTQATDIHFDAFATGMARFSKVGKDKITFLDTTTDIDATVDPLLREIGTDTSWWITADYKYKVTSNKLDGEETSYLSIFYNNRDEEGWIRKLALMEDEDLLVGGEPNEKLVRAFRMGFWALWEQDLKTLRRMSTLAGRRGGELDRYVPFLGNVQRKPDEADAALRTRTRAELQRRFGGVTVENIQDFVESFLSLPADTVIVHENKDPTTSEYVSAFFYIELDVGQLPAGITQADVLELLKRMKSIGVKVDVRITTTAEYDSAVYDTDKYGS